MHMHTEMERSKIVRKYRDRIGSEWIMGETTSYASKKETAH